MNKTDDKQHGYTNYMDVIIISSTNIFNPFQIWSIKQVIELKPYAPTPSFESLYFSVSILES